jgi:hypothetical protein
MRRSVESLERLRGFRNRPERDVTIGAMVKAAEREVKKQQRAVGGVGLAWDEVVPRTLAARCTVVGVSRGVLTVRTAGAATRFELDRFLRSGGEAELCRRAGVAIRKVKLV